MGKLTGEISLLRVDSQGREFRLRLSLPQELSIQAAPSLEISPELQRLLAESKDREALVARRLAVARSAHEFLTDFAEIIVSGSLDLHIDKHLDVCFMPFMWSRNLL